MNHQPNAARQNGNAARSPYPCAVILTFVGWLAAAGVQAEIAVRFVEEGAARGINAYHMAPGNGGGLAAADFDGDGDIDIFVPNADGHPDQLYQNDGTGRFSDVAEQFGVASMSSARCALWFDYDADHDLDLLVVNDDETRSSTFVLYANEGSRFEDRTVEADLQIPLPPRIDDITIPFRGGISAGDLNHDGYLDLFVTMWNGKSQLLYNNRDGTFTDATATANVNTALHYGHQPALFDFDGDGLLDIYLAVDFLWNALYLNNGDQTFTDHAAEVRLDNAMNDMGMALGDIDNDGDFDIYITNIFQPFQYNVLYRNDSVPGRMSFTEIAQASGADYGGWGWGATFLDADNDGRLDIAATNGWETPTFQFDKSVFYHNRLGRQIKFDDVSASVGFNDNEWGSGLIALDVDRDGDLDLMQTCNNGPLRLLINHQSRLADRRNHLTVKPRMKGNNHFAIGAVVRIETEELTTVRLIHAGTSFMSQEPAEAVFGLGKQTSVKRLQITWPDGSRSEYVDVPANQVLVVEHAGDGDLDADNDIDHHDFRRMTQCVNTIDSPTQCRPADLNHDHATDLKDIAHFQNRMQIQTP